MNKDHDSKQEQDPKYCFKQNRLSLPDPISRCSRDYWNRNSRQPGLALAEDST
jgi:hypothetical protein